MKRIRFYATDTLKWIDIDEEGVIINASTWKEELLEGKLIWPENLRKGDMVYFQDKNGKSKELPGRVESTETINQEVAS